MNLNINENHRLLKMIQPTVVQFIMALYFCSAYAQSPLLNKQQKQYFDYIKQAHHFVYTAEYKKADSIYQYAFALKGINPFQIDYSNALVIADLLGEDKKSAWLIEKLISEKGVDTLEILRLLPEIRQKANLWKNIRIQYSSFKLKFIAKIDTVYRNKIEEIIQSDQKFHLRKAKFTDQELKSRDSIDQVNFNEIKKMIKERGFPSEKRIGCYIGEYAYSIVLHTLFRHFIQRGDFSDLYPIIRKAVESGELHPALFANSCDTGKEALPSDKRCSFNYQTSLIEYVGAKAYLPFIDYSRSNFDCINTNRINIGLDSFHIAQQQYVCQGVLYHPTYKTSRYVFVPYMENTQLPAFLFKDDPKTLEKNTFKKIEAMIDKCPCICN